MEGLCSSLSIGLASLQHFEISSTLTDPTTINRVNLWDRHKLYLFLLAKIFQCFYILVSIIFDYYHNVYKTVFIDIKVKFFS